jgi:hypothetical protein
MSILVRLLTTGKSLVDLRDTTSRYRMPHKNLLPKFGSAKNPFVARSEVRPGQAMLIPAARTAPAGRKLTPAEMKAASMKETRQLPALSTPAATATISKPVAPAKAKLPARTGAWLRKLNPLAWWPKRQTIAKAAVPGFNKVPVQGELSLDNVKVVRNDLSDADVEIVPAKPAAITTAKPVAKTETKAELAGVQTS